MLIVAGFILTLVGVSNSYSDYTRLNSTQLALKTVTEVLAPDLTITGVGLFFLVLGLLIFFAPSNKAATRSIRWVFKNR